MTKVLTWLILADKRSGEGVTIETISDLMFSILGKFFATFMGLGFCLCMAAIIANEDFESSGIAFSAVFIGGIISAILLTKSPLTGSFVVISLIMLPWITISLFRRCARLIETKCEI